MKRVLIAIDYAQTALKVVDIGAALAKKMRAEATLIHVITDPIFYSSKEYSPIIGFTGHLEMEQIQVDSIVGLKKAAIFFLEEVKKHLNDKTIKILVGEGSTAETILEVADDLKVDIIIIGSHSHKWLESIVMGSVAEKIMNHTHIPLLIVPTKRLNS